MVAPFSTCPVLKMAQAPQPSVANQYAPGGASRPAVQGPSRPGYLVNGRDEEAAEPLSLEEFQAYQRDLDTERLQELANAPPPRALSALSNVPSGIYPLGHHGEDA